MIYEFLSKWITQIPRPLQWNWFKTKTLLRGTTGLPIPGGDKKLPLLYEADALNCDCVMVVSHILLGIFTED